MTLAKVIENFDNERKNSLPYGQKVNWLSQLDMKISSELLEPRGEGDFSGYTETTSPETVVRAPEEYCEIYGLYLNMKLDYLNGEIARFNNSASLFNVTYSEMSDFINRRKKVLKNTQIKAGALYV